MSRRIGWERRAQTEFSEIMRRDRRLAQRIFAAIGRYAENDLGDVRKLAGGESYRLRIGDWRVLFDLDEGGHLMIITRIANRRDAYRWADDLILTKRHLSTVWPSSSACWGKEPADD